MRSRSLQYGVTLLEVLLGLAIVSSITVLSLRTFQSLSREAKLRSLAGNVETYFNAAAQFYMVNCNGTYKEGGAPNAENIGLLNPARIPPPGMYTTVFGAGSTNPLSAFLPATIPGNVLIDPNDGIVVQFNAQYSNVFTRACESAPFNSTTQRGTICPPTTKDSPIPPAQAKSIMTGIQVAVKLVASTSAAAFKGTLGADCTSNLDPTLKYVMPCSATSTGPYAVWLRPVSMAAPNMSTNLWMSKANLMQFNLQYTHDQMYEMNSGYKVSAPPQYYLCSG